MLDEDIMPTSHHRQISTIIEAIVNLNPHSVLDIGVGFGKYGVLCREYLELWDGREDYHHFTRRIDGVEAFEDYLTSLHRYIYDTIYIGPAQTVVKTLTTTYDLVLMIDVLEHLTETQGRMLLRYLLAHHRGVLISTPKRMDEQGTSFHNPFETHLTQWTLGKLNALGPAIRFSDAESHIVYLGTHSSILQLRAKQRWEKLKHWGKKIPLAKKLYRRFTSQH